MKEVITMDKSGRLVLPGRIRRALHVKEPTAFKAEVVGNKVELTPLQPASGAIIKKRKGLLVISTGGQEFDAAEALRALRDERV
jgi:bifunctional DNA-binding transcriptional regulator/antitoxin component of YhaV-PrlF toxin-antitoxin module